MRKGLWLLPFLLVVLLFSGTAFAALTPPTLTVNEPTALTVYCNNSANRETIDLNLHVVDGNAAGRADRNILITYLGEGDTTWTSISADWNAMSGASADKNCVGADGDALDGWDVKDCTYKWTMPLDSTMQEGIWVVNMRLQDYNKGLYEAGFVNDTNKTVQISTMCRLTTAGTTKTLAGNIGLVLAGIVLVMALFAIMGFKTGMDVTSVVTMTVAAGIVAGIAAMVIGLVLNIL